MYFTKEYIRKTITAKLKKFSIWVTRVEKVLRSGLVSSGFKLEKDGGSVKGRHG